jgi:hypothetical protein
MPQSEVGHIVGPLVRVDQPRNLLLPRAHLLGLVVDLLLPLLGKEVGRVTKLLDLRGRRRERGVGGVPTT